MKPAKVIICIAIFALLAYFVVSPPPMPHSVSGTIFRPDATTPVPLGTKYQVLDLNSSFSVRSQTKIPIPGMSGDYFETVQGSDGDKILIIAWNATNYGRKSYTLLGDMQHANVTLNTTRPPEVKIKVTVPGNNSMKQINQTFNVTANITAIGGSSSVGCNASIRFSNTYVLNLSVKENATHVLGNIALGASAITTWRVIGRRGWSVNVTALAKCSSDGDNFEKLNNNTVYNITINDAEQPHVSLRSPKNLSWSKSVHLVLFYNVTDFSGIENCSLYFDKKLNKTNTSVKTSVPQSFTANMIDGNHSWFVSCIDNSSRHNRANSSNWLIRVDTIGPNVTLKTPYNNFVTVNLTMVFQFNVTDANQVMNCSLIVNNSIAQTNTGIVRGKLLNFTRKFRHGSYYWRINCTDAAGNTGNSTTRQFNVTQPDFFVAQSDIHFSTSAPVEGQNVTINVSVHNIGDANGTNVIVRFYENLSSEVQFASVTMNIPAKKTLFAVANWVAKIGKHMIYVAADPPLATNGSIAEINETNNMANRSLYIRMWQVFYGNLIGTLTLSSGSNSSLVLWTNISKFFGNVYVTDSDCAISWPNLQALGKNLSNKTELNDFKEIDVTLNTSYFNDSVNRTYLAKGLLKTASFTIYNRNIPGVPIVNSTNSSNFVTGILWDYSDLKLESYNGSQDVVFVGNVARKKGAYGTYDYEIRIPANLRKYRKPNVQNTVTFYTEII